MANGPAVRMTIKDNGNVGIATTAPTGKLHIYQSGDSQPAFFVEGSQGSLFSVEDTLTGSLMSVNDIAGLPVFEAFDDGTIVMGQYNSGDLIVTGNKVGIGTLAPAVNSLHLHHPVRTDIKLSCGAAASNGDHYIRKDGRYIRVRGHDDSTVILEIQNNSDSNKVCMPNGNVGIGTTNPSNRLEVRGPNTIAPFKLVNSSNSNRRFLQVSSQSNYPRLTLYNNTEADTIHLDTNGVSYFKGGSVAIGTGSAATNLEVVQSDFSDALAITLTRNSDLNSLPNTQISRIQFSCLLYTSDAADE